MSTRATFGAAIACLLLAAYVYLVGYAIFVVHCPNKPECLQTFNADMTGALAIIGGLVSALVISELAVTQPGEPPLARTISPDAPAATSRALRILTWGYLASGHLLASWHYSSPSSDQSSRR
jgi:hypothetical protein